MIQTSFFSSKAPRGRKVSIAKWPPRHWQGPRAPMLAPTNPRAENWAEAYRRDLDARFPNATDLHVYLKKIEAETPDPILCCFEQKPEECHRRVLAAFIREKLGWDVPEWSAPKPEQASLF